MGVTFLERRTVESYREDDVWLTTMWLQCGTRNQSPLLLHFTVVMYRGVAGHGAVCEGGREGGVQMELSRCRRRGHLPINTPTAITLSIRRVSHTWADFFAGRLYGDGVRGTGVLARIDSWTERTRYVCTEPVVMRYLDVPEQVLCSQDTRPRGLAVEVVLAEHCRWEERWFEEGKGGV